MHLIGSLASAAAIATTIVGAAPLATTLKDVNGVACDDLQLVIVPLRERNTDISVWLREWPTRAWYDDT